MKKCPKCNSNELKKYDVIKRLIKNKNGEKQWIDVQRYKCKKCNSVHRQLPEFIVPFKHYNHRRSSKWNNHIRNFRF